MTETGSDVRLRLRVAALTLFDAQGFDQTTATQIAEHAGVNRRTFFRYFADKRDVLFEDEALRDLLLRGMAAAPAALPPIEAIRFAFRSAAPLLEANGSVAGLRRKVIAATPTLRERALGRAAMLADELAARLGDRGVDSHLAALASRVGMAACDLAVSTWSSEATDSFETHLDRSFSDLHDLLGHARRAGS